MTKNKITDCRWDAQLCISAKQPKCLTAKVKHETSFIPYLKMPCRLETIVGEPFDGLVVFLSLLHVNLEKLSRKTSITDYAFLKHLVQLPWVQKTTGRLMPRRGMISQGYHMTHRHTTELWLILAPAALWSHLLWLGQLHSVCKVCCRRENW